MPIDVNPQPNDDIITGLARIAGNQPYEWQAITGRMGAMNLVANYTTITSGTTRTWHIVTADTKKIRAVVTGLTYSSTIQGLDEQDFPNQFEVKVAVEGPKLDNGGMTAVTGTTCEDTTKNWPVNGWTGCYVRNVSTGGLARIVSNTVNVLTVTGTWAGSVTHAYEIIRLVLLKWGGKEICWVKPGQVIESDVAALQLRVGEKIWLRTFCNRIASTGFSTASGEVGNLASNQTNWPVARVVRGLVAASGGFASLEGIVSSTSTGVDPFLQDLTGGGLISPANGNAYLPVVLAGEVHRARSKAVAFVGDSILTNYGDGHNGAGQILFGFAGRGLGDNYASIRMPEGSEQLWHWNKGRCIQGFLMCRYARIAIINLGTNDIIVAGATTTLIKTYLQTLIQDLKDAGLRVYMCTIWPRSTSTGGWTTLGDQTTQTAVSFNASRIVLNDWLRGNWSAIGLSGLIETADKVESARNSGLWATSGSVDTGTCTGGTATQLDDTGKAWTVDQWAGYSVFNITKTETSAIIRNTATALILQNGAPFWTSPTAGNTYRIVASNTFDGTHPNGLGHVLAATAIPATL